MIDQDEFLALTRVMPFLKNADNQLLNEFRHIGSIANIPAGKDVFVVGDHANAIAILVSGIVRVYIIGETGREITLYRFGSGESCILTANAILNEQDFPAIANVEKDARAVMIPEDSFRDWVRRYDLWREFVFDLLSKRLLSMMAVVDEVVFRRMDRRIASFLLYKARGQNPVSITHQEIASELGSSREVVSRLIEDFQSEGMVRSGRNSIEIVDFASLESLSLT